jgi:hypothetical protein
MRPFASACVLVVLGCRVAPSLETGSDGDAGPVSGPDPDDDAAALGGTAGTTASSGGERGGSSGHGGTSSAHGGSGGGAHPDDQTAGAADTASERAGQGGEQSRLPASTTPTGAGSPVAACDAQDATLDEIRAGELRTNARIRLDAVATSQKFLVSHTQSGRCLFGAFVGADPAADGPRGVLLVAYGADAAENQPCEPGHDAIPDDLAPGDAVGAVAYFTTYAPSTCTGVAPAPQLMLQGECSLSRNGRRVLPAPFVLSHDQATRLAAGTDAAFVRRFAGGLVRLEGMSSVRPEEGVGSVGAYGVVRFAETALELHNDLEYGDLTLGGPADAAKSLVFPYPTRFDSVTGLVYLDYCTWALAPRSRCSDLDPASDNCP